MVEGVLEDTWMMAKTKGSPFTPAPGSRCCQRDGLQQPFNHKLDRLQEEEIID